MRRGVSMLIRDSIADCGRVWKRDKEGGGIEKEGSGKNYRCKHPDVSKRWVCVSARLRDLCRVQCQSPGRRMFRSAFKDEIEEERGGLEGKNGEKRFSQMWRSVNG